MKNKIIPFILMLCVLMLCTPAQGATVSTQFKSIYTGDEFFGLEIPSSGTRGTIAKSPAAAALDVVDDNGNYVYRMGGSSNTHAMIIHTYFDNDTSFAQTKYQKYTARVKLPSSTGKTHLFAMERGWGVAVNADTAGVVLENGGAYYYDVPTGKYVNFIADNTMNTDEWYTIEVIYDFSNCTKDAGDIVMYGTVYNKDNDVVGSSGKAHVSEQKSYADNANFTYMRSQIRFSGYAEDSDVLLDDIGMYKLAVTPVTCTTDEISEESATFTFSEALDTSTITKENIILQADNPALDMSDKYDIDYTDGTLTVFFEDLPYNESFNIKITTDVRAEGDVFGLPEEINVPFSSPADPLVSACETAEFSTEGNGVVAEITLNNTASKSREYLLVVTSWNSDNVCVDIKSLAGTIASQSQEVLTLPAVSTDGSGNTIRLSLLDNWYSITPIGDAAEVKMP